MSIKEANSKIDNIDNQIEYWLSIKELEELKYENGRFTDKIEFNKICKYIDKKIDCLYSSRNKLHDFIDDYLKEINKYDEVLQEIIYYKEISLEDYTWYQIANKVHYSSQHCKKMYSKYKNKRYID